MGKAMKAIARGKAKGKAMKAIANGKAMKTIEKGNAKGKTMKAMKAMRRQTIATTWWTHSSSKKWMDHLEYMVNKYPKLQIKFLS